MGDRDPKAISKQASQKRSKAEKTSQRKQETILSKQQSPDKSDRNDKKR